MKYSSNIPNPGLRKWAKTNSLHSINHAFANRKKHPTEYYYPHVKRDILVTIIRRAEENQEAYFLLFRKLSWGNEDALDDTITNAPGAISLN